MGLSLPLAILLQLALSGGAPRVVVLDPGHGGTQEGAVGICDLKEKDVTLHISIELARLLNTSGKARAILTRTTDKTLGLRERTRLANRAKAHLFVSIHANASTTSKGYGIETYFLSQQSSDKQSAQTALRENEGLTPTLPKEQESIDFILKQMTHNAAHRQSQQLAIHFETILKQSLHSRGRGVLQAPFVVLLEAEMPAVLVEVGFLSNPEECEQISDPKYQAKIAQALSTAIISHLAKFAKTEKQANLLNLP